ncbi:prepilin-type N-terminal cleavage/methylation domain-containing protein [Leucobacter soli]|uniref:prepilin-type N-terminal cleavage/methylation domain-containing protein n=1 Tax=Leucobacter soli TaxID=2812850 RepID=UPI001C4018A5|nr:prepilin-type N-terminal cleavage/methylation domain-containing protein [Leucobacter soli]
MSKRPASCARPLRRAEGTRTSPLANDHGFSLVELIVAFSIFAVFLSVFIAGLIGLTRTTATATNRIEASTSVGLLYQRIDPTVRFAQEINAPGVSGGRAYIEYFTGADASSDVKNHCTQLRYDPTAATISMRRWSWTGGTSHQDPPSGTAWQTLAADVLPGGTGAPATYPFTRTKATLDAPYQRLVLQLRVGAEGYSAETTSTNTFIARNTTVLSETNTGGQVCDGGGTVERP